MTSQSAFELAQKITDELFTDANGNRGDCLSLFARGKELCKYLYKRETVNYIAYLILTAKEGK